MRVKSLNKIAARFRGGTGAALVTTALWQIANYIIPLVTFPYLARVLGPHGFGVLGMGTAIITYVLILTDWGFNFTATQQAARCRHNAVELNKVVWSTIYAKMMLGFLSSISVLLVCYSFSGFEELRQVLVISLLMVVGAVFNVDWSLRATEHFGSFVTASLVGRILTLPVVFLFVQSSSDVPAAAFATASATPLTAVISLLAARKLRILGRPYLNMRDVFASLGAGTHVFVSTAIGGLYTNSLALILGATGGVQQAGFFSGADKIRRPAQSMFAPLAMVFFPRLNYLSQSEPEQAKRVSLKVLRVQSAGAFILAAGLCGSSPFVVRTLLGEAFDGAVPVLRVLSWVVFVGGVNNVLGLMIMLPFGLKREFTLCLGLGAISGIGLAVPLSIIFGPVGTAVARFCGDSCDFLNVYNATKSATMVSGKCIRLELEPLLNGAKGVCSGAQRAGDMICGRVSASVPVGLSALF